MIRKSAAAVSIIALLSTTGCQTDNITKQDVGTAVGVGAGLLIGSQLGGGTGRYVAMGVGALIGGYLGNQLGKMLDEKDQQAVSAQTAKALAESKDGQAVNWSNPETGAKAKITPISTATEQRSVAVVREKKVAPVPAMDLIGETYVANKSANLRSAPNQSADTLGGLQAGERFQAVGKVSGSDWIVVGKGKRTVGYVHASLVKKAPPPPPALAQLPSEVVTDQPPQLTKPVNLDEVKATEVADLDKLGLVAEMVPAKTTCRMAKMEVSGKGESTNDTVKSCKGTNGMWEVQI
ncbi:SH3 domain-containing protein [Paramagnetospirillum magneticum]|nr:SH3 domain-containing protein [Paramagnetospirillum magneticum]